MRLLSGLLTLLAFGVTIGADQAQPPQFKPLPAPPDVAKPPADAAKTASGLAYKVLEPGTGTAKPGAEDFVTVHHELGHNFYQRAYNQQPFLYRTGANDGFHEAIGDAVALSITPQYLVKIGLLPTVPKTQDDVEFLLAANTGAEPLGSMGTDTPVAVLSDRPRLLFDYFAQLWGFTVRLEQQFPDGRVELVARSRPEHFRATA